MVQGKSIILATSFIKLLTAFILLSTAFIILQNATIIQTYANIKLLTAFYILATAFIKLSTANIKLLTANNILASEKLHLVGATINRKQYANAQEKAHLQSAPPNAKPKIVKELSRPKKVYTFYINTKIRLQFKYNSKIYLQPPFFCNNFSIYNLPF